MNLIKILLLSLCLASCLKTTEEIQKESQADSPVIELDQSKIMMSNLINKNKEMEEQIMLLHGKIDDLKYSNTTKSNEATGENTEQARIDKLEIDFKNLKDEVEKQREFIKKVTDNLVIIQRSLQKR